MEFSVARIEFQALRDKLKGPITKEEKKQQKVSLRPLLIIHIEKKIVI